MPINDFKCTKCGEEFEHFQVRSDDKPECPKCQAKEKDLEKQPPKGTGFILKGGGWFADGY